MSANPSENATLSVVEIRFTCADGNKDANSAVTARVKTRDSTIVAERTGWNNEEFDDEGNWTGWTNLEMRGQGHHPSHLKGGKFYLEFNPHGHDDWDAIAELRFNWSDGTVQDLGQYGTYELSHNNRRVEVDLKAPYQP